MIDSHFNARWAISGSFCVRNRAHFMLILYYTRLGYNVQPPGGESLAQVVKRTIPFFKKYIERHLLEGKNVLVVSSHNSTRAIVKYVENISDKDIINVEIPFGGLRRYEFQKGVYKKII